MDPKKRIKTDDRSQSGSPDPETSMPWLFHPNKTTDWTDAAAAAADVRAERSRQWESELIIIMIFGAGRHLASRDSLLRIIQVVVASVGVDWQWFLSACAHRWFYRRFNLRLHGSALAATRRGVCVDGRCCAVGFLHSLSMLLGLSS